MNTFKTAGLPVASAILAATISVAPSPAPAMPVAHDGGSAALAQGPAAKGPFLRVQGRGDGGRPLDSPAGGGSPAWQQGGYGGYYGYGRRGQGGWQGAPYGPAVVPQSGSWCYYHPYRCR
ncbi:MAG: hypothetical protein ACHQAY_07830 [Hyphomicrobiales bacterium]